MKIFVAYRFTGEDINELKKTLSKIRDTLESREVDIFCSLFFEEHFKSKDFSLKERYEFCLQKLKEHDVILFFIKSEERSTGMELELERAIKDKKKIILAIQENLDFADFRENTHQLIEFNELSDLYDLLAKIDLHF